MADLVTAISFTGVADALYDVAVVIAGILIVRKGIRYVLGFVK